MTCERIQDLLPDFLQGGLDSSGNALVQDHLKACPACAGLLSALRDTQEALHAFPELEVKPELLGRLQAIPEKAGKPRFNLLDFLRPAAQPVLSAATAFLFLFSLYTFNPEKKSIDRFFSRQFHQGYNAAGKLYAKAGYVADEIDSFKDTILGSLKDLNILSGQKDQNE